MKQRILTAQQRYQHLRWLARMADDSKHERRKPKRRRQRALEDYNLRGAKFRNRTKSFVNETCSQIVGVASRNRVIKIIYDDKQQEYFPTFQWAMLRAQLAVKCDEAEIELGMKSVIAERRPA